MEHRTLILRARLTSSLSLLGILLCIHINFTLAHFLPSETKWVMDAMYFFYFAGAVLGVVLCPLFLPAPGVKNKPLLFSICFISFFLAVEVIFRFFGISVWLGSAAIRSIMAVSEGIITAMCHGLFYLTWLRKPRPAVSSGHENRTGRFCSLVLGAALLVSVLTRCYSVPLLEASVAAVDPFKGAEFSFGLIKWCMIFLGVSLGLCVFLIHKAAVDSPHTADYFFTEPAIKTNWSIIIRLIGLASVFTILNGTLDVRMLPLYSNESMYHPHYLTVAAVILIFGFLAGRSIDRFIRWYMPPAVVLFILVSCLPLFEDYPRINLIMSTMISIAHYTAWMVFTTAVVEKYAGGFWFYGITLVIFFTVAFAFLAPVISPFVPDSTEYIVLFIVLAAVSFMLLAFRLIFPKQPQSSVIPAKKRREQFPETSGFDEIFKERGLSQREIEVACLLVDEGLGKKEIGERLYISAGTVKIHISKIYQKFGVSNQREFITLFVNREQ